MCERAKDPRGSAVALKGLGNACIAMSRLAEGLKCYERAQAVFTECQDLQGLGDIEQALGDFHSRQKKTELATTRYLAAADFYEKGQRLHDLANAKLELLRIKVEEHNALAKEDTPRPVTIFRLEIDELIALCHRTKNGYAWRQLVDLHLVDPKNQGHQP